MTAPTQADKGAAFRALHASGCFVLPNPWDAGSARLLAAAGFAALATTSAGLAFSLGRRDGAVSREEALANARAIVAATDLPVSADLENGYGPRPQDAAETIRQAAETGLVGGSIEDASGDPARPIYDPAHAAERIAAAVEAARSLPIPFVLTARAENFLHGRPDLDDTIRRLLAFQAAGAEVLYAPGLPDMHAVRTVVDALGAPLNVLAAPGFDVAGLAQAGVRRVSLGSGLYRAACTGLLAAVAALHDGRLAFLAEPPGFAALTAAMPLH